MQADARRVKADAELLQQDAQQLQVVAVVGKGMHCSRDKYYNFFVDWLIDDWAMSQKII